LDFLNWIFRFSKITKLKLLRNTQTEIAVTNDQVPALEDVTQAAKVSTAAVWKCLNALEKVNEKTQLRVLSVVQRLEYSPTLGRGHWPRMNLPE